MAFSRLPIARLAATAAALVLILACSGDSPTQPQPETLVPTTIQLSQSSLLLSLQAKGSNAITSFQLTAIVLDQKGGVMSGQAVTWGSNTESVASVSPAGLVSAVGKGKATVTASAGSASASAQVQVTSSMLPKMMLIVSGQAQVDTVGKEVKNPLIVRVLNEDSIPVKSQIVNWVITRGGGSVFAGAALTDSLGQARETWTLGTIADSAQAVEARAVDTQSGANLTFAKFTATAVADVPASVVLASDTVLSGTAGSYAAASEGNDTLTVRVKDQYGNVVKGAAVTWSATVGDGTVEALAETADSTGRARARWLLGPDLRAQQEAQATSSGLSSGSFRADASVPDDAVLTRLAGDEQVDSAGKQLADTLVVGLALADGRTVQGAGLTWAVVGERGSVSEVAAGTDAEGKGRALWTLGSRVGADSVRVAVDSTAIETYFTATVQAFRLRMSAATLTLTSLGESQTLSAALLDQSGAEVSADNVTWTSSDETVATVSNGTVTSIDNGTAVIRASRAGARPDSATVTVSQVAASITLSQDSVLLVAVGDTLTAAYTVRDALGQPLTGTTVTWAVADSFGVGVDPANGLLTARRWGATTLAVRLGDLADTLTVVSRGIVGAPVAVGSYHTCAITNSVTPSCWGRNNVGQLGDGGLADGLNPTSVTPVMGRPISVAAAVFNSCAIDEDAHAWCWGENNMGQVGDGTRTNQPSPTMVPLEHVTSISLGYWTTCAMQESRYVYCWGSDQLGNGNQAVARTAPVQVDLPDGASGHWVDVSVGNLSTCALTSSGEAWCWGSTLYGALGNGTLAAGYEASPVRVVGGMSWAQVAVGYGGACGLTAQGSAYCWGRAYGLGSNTDADHASPRQVSGGHIFTDLSTGPVSSLFCGRTTSREVWCWGIGTQGQLGNGSWGPEAVEAGKAPQRPATSSDSEFLTASIHSCSVTSSLGLECWGIDHYGELGRGEALAVNTTLDVDGWPAFRPDRHSILSPLRSCGITTSDQAFCWGDNRYGSAGTGSSLGLVNRPELANVPGTHAFVAVGNNHACVAGGYRGRELFCWGLNTNGELGGGTVSNGNVNLGFEPRTNVKLGLMGLLPGGAGAQSDITSLSAGLSHTCYTNALKQLGCWGTNIQGQLGRGALSLAESAPAPVTGEWSFVTAGLNHSCALAAPGWLSDAGGEALCWGHGTSGELGDGLWASSATPVRVAGGLTFQSLVAGTGFTCGLSDAVAYCWGRNNFAQLGSGTTADSAEPVAVVGGHAFERLYASTFGVCGLTAETGVVRCWGSSGGGGGNNRYNLGQNVRLTEPTVWDSGTPAESLFHGFGTLCAQQASGAVRCTGYNVSGTFGDGNPRLTPFTVPALSIDARLGTWTRYRPS